MFKAKLIEKESYYILTKKEKYFQLCFIIIGFLINPTYPFIGILVIGYLALMINILLIIYNRLYWKDKYLLIEINQKEIIIKSKKGLEKEIIHLNLGARLTVKSKYFLRYQSYTIFGKSKRNYVILLQNKLKRRFDLEIDSPYMLIQLNKVIDQWQKEGYNIERIK